MADKYASETTEGFSSRIFDIISGGFTGISIALGVKSGLFDVLVDHHDKPMTSQELADAAGLKERYVREWLGAMTTAYIVDLDPVTEKYHLPTHRIDSFRSGTMEGRMAEMSIGIPVHSEVFNSMLETVKIDGPRGLASVTKSFEEFVANFWLSWNNHCLLQQFISSQPEIKSRLESGIRMLDLGCGRSSASRILAQRFPDTHFVGLDIQQCHVDLAIEEAAKLGLKNIEYVCADAAAMPDDWTSTFDYIFIFNVLHDTPRPDLVIDEVKRVMKKDGILSLFEMDAASKHADNMGNAASSFLYTSSLFFCLPLSYHFPDSLGWGVMWGKERISEFLEEKGFVVRSVTGTPKAINAHFMCELK